MGAGCKPAGFCLRWFESNTLHKYFPVVGAPNHDLPSGQAQCGSNGAPLERSSWPGRRIRRRVKRLMPSTSTSFGVRGPSSQRASLVHGRTSLRPSSAAGHSQARMCSRPQRVVSAMSGGSNVSKGWASELTNRLSAGVAQLVERQPSKLNVASSSLVSRSVFIRRGRSNPRLPLFLVRGCPNPRRSLDCYPAHLAQLVEHVLGKDEVTSSILVVGSKRMRDVAADGLPRVEHSSVPVFGLGRAQTMTTSVEAA